MDGMKRQLTQTATIEKHCTLAPSVQLRDQRQQGQTQSRMKHRLDGSWCVEPHEVERIGIVECLWRQRSVEQRNIGNLADEDDAEEERNGAEDGRLEEAHLVDVGGALSRTLQQAIPDVKVGRQLTCCVNVGEAPFARDRRDFGTGRTI